MKKIYGSCPHAKGNKPTNENNIYSSFIFFVLYFLIAAFFSSYFSVCYNFSLFFFSSNSFTIIRKVKNKNLQIYPIPT